MTLKSGARTRLGAVGLVLAALLLVGCRVDTEVAVVVAGDGSGTVTVTVSLDRAASRRIPDLGEQLRTRDLERTGWAVSGPEPAAEGGGVVVTATKEFFAPEQAAAVLDEVGIITGELERRRSFGSTEYEFTGSLDVSGGLATFSDPELTELLGGLPVGEDPNALADELGAPVRRLSSFTATVTLPEGDEQVTSEWEAQLNDPPVELAAETSERNLLALGLAGGAALAVVLLALLLVVRLVRGAVRRRRR